MANQKAHKLDIFKTLNAINGKNTAFFDSLDEEEKKAFQPLVVMRWLSGIQNPIKIMYLNELVNPLVFPFGKHPKLLFYLMTACCSGQKERASWPKQKSISQRNLLNVIKKYYEYNTRQAIDALQILKNEDVLEICAELGLQKDELKKVKVELKSR